MEKKYRIKEYDATFRIEIFDFKTIGMWWWKKIEGGWYNTNTLGDRMYFYGAGSALLSEEFKSLKKAKKQIEIWKKGPTYHYMENFKNME